MLTTSMRFFLVGFAAEYSPFYGIEKGAVLQEARVFNDPQLDARRCAQVRQHFCLFILSFASTDRFFVFLSVSVFNCNFRVATKIQEFARSWFLEEDFELTFGKWSLYR